LRVRDPGTALQEVEHGLAGAALGLLVEVTDRRVRRSKGEPTLEVRADVVGGERAQQGRLAGAVRTDEPPYVARGDREGQVAEQLARPVRGAEALDVEGHRHLSRLGAAEGCFTPFPGAGVLREGANQRWGRGRRRRRAYVGS